MSKTAYRKALTLKILAGNVYFCFCHTGKVVFLLLQRAEKLPLRVVRGKSFFN